MLGFALKRLGLAVLVAVAVSALAFLLLRASGDVATALAGEGARAEDIENIRRIYGLDRPLVAQYFEWIGKMAHGDFGRRFERILLDTPCSGTGTLARNPEIKWRLLPSDIEELHGRQVVLLRNALQSLAPRGLLVYSTCSLEREENEGVIEALGGLSPVHTMHRVPGLQPGDGFFAAVIRSR